MKKLKFTFHGKDLYANMLPDEAPMTCAAMEAACPFETRWVHAKLVYNEVFCPAPVFGPSERENPMPNVPGDIGFFDLVQTICCWHGEMTPLGAGNVFARFTPEQMAAFHEEAVKLWEEQACPVIVDVVDED